MPFAELLQQTDRTFVIHRGRKLIYFGGCDYFRMSSHPAVRRALHQGADRFGLNVAASRSTTGNHVLFGKLEQELARFFGTAKAMLLSNGYATNLAFAQSFADSFTHALIDERSHGSLLDATRFLNCPVKKFAHRDASDFRRAVQSCGRSARPLALTDGLFAHDGSIAPLSEYLEALPRRATLLVDDAHGAGTLGRRGRGTAEHLGIQDHRIVQTISLSKALGVYGGAVLGSERVIGALGKRSRILVGNTPLPLPLANAALASLRILRQDNSLRARLDANTSRIKSALRSAGFSVPDNSSPIVSFAPRTTRHAASLSRALLRCGIYPPLIHYSGARPYFRFAISSEHTRTQLDALIKALTDWQTQSPR